jgi:SAM-dependent methyltransferase
MINLQIDEAGVSRDISPHDLMLDRVSGERAYYSCGRSAIGCIMDSLHGASKPTTEIRRVLDLPSGHGRVLRYLKVAFPQAEITACDLLHDGVDFCASTFGAVPVYSNADPGQIPLERNAFDLIWVGSLFTHLDSDLWSKFLNGFHSWLRTGGLLVFSTHGHQAYRDLKLYTRDYGISYWRRTSILYTYERTGFGYATYAGSESYGISLSHPTWVIRQVAKIPEMRLVHFSEKSWTGFQDIFACIRDPDWQSEPRCASSLTYLRHTVLDALNPRLAAILVALRFGLARWLRRSRLE